MENTKNQDLAMESNKIEIKLIFKMNSAWA